MLLSNCLFKRSKSSVIQSFYLEFSKSLLDSVFLQNCKSNFLNTECILTVFLQCLLPNGAIEWASKESR